MVNLFKKSAILFIGLAFASFVSAQEMMTDKKIEMADGLRSNGKIYVVVAVVVTILLGILFYLFQLDRKITKLENNQ